MMCSINIVISYIKIVFVCFSTQNHIKQTKKVSSSVVFMPVFPKLLYESAKLEINIFLVSLINHIIFTSSLLEMYSSETVQRIKTR